MSRLEVQVINPHSTIHIDLSALNYNFEVISTLAPNSKILAMIKANAYGHGLIEIARALPNANGFGVACISEALALRNADISQKILLMRGVYDQAELDIIEKYNIDIMVHSAEQLSFLSSSQAHWIKINTGMNRLGFFPEDIEKNLPKFKNKKIIFITHFANAEEDLSFTLQQIEKFEAVMHKIKEVNIEKSLANSAGILNFPTAHADWVRPGLMLYGVLPMPHDIHLKPVMTWESRLIAVRMQRKGDKIGYESAYACEENMPVGIVGVGYGDGYPRHAPNGTPVLVNGVECPLVGRVSMDMLAVDLRHVPSAKINDPVILWGRGLPIEKVAASMGSNVRELLCNARLRVK